LSVAAARLHTPGHHLFNGRQQWGIKTACWGHG